MALRLKRQSPMLFACFFVALSPKEIAQALMRFFEIGSNAQSFLEMFAG